MGKGDIRSRRGKIFRGTYGVTRLKKKKLKKKAAEAAKAAKVEGHRSEAQSRRELVCRPLREKQATQRALTALPRSEEHTSELQSRRDLVCRLLLEKKKDT